MISEYWKWSPRSTRTPDESLRGNPRGCVASCVAHGLPWNWNTVGWRCIWNFGSCLVASHSFGSAVREDVAGVETGKPASGWLLTPMDPGRLYSIAIPVDVTKDVHHMPRKKTQIHMVINRNNCRTQIHLSVCVAYTNAMARRWRRVTHTADEKESTRQKGKASERSSGLWRTPRKAHMGNYNRWQTNEQFPSGPPVPGRGASGRDGRAAKPQWKCCREERESRSIISSILRATRPTPRQPRSSLSRVADRPQSAALNRKKHLLCCLRKSWSWSGPPASRIPARAYKKSEAPTTPAAESEPQRVRGREKWRAGRAGTTRSRGVGGGGGGCGRRASRGRGASRCLPPTRGRRLPAPARGRASRSRRIWSSRSMGSSEGVIFLPFLAFFLYSVILFYLFCYFPLLMTSWSSIRSQTKLAVSRVFVRIIGSVLLSHSETLLWLYSKLQLWQWWTSASAGSLPNFVALQYGKRHGTMIVGLTGGSSPESIRTRGTTVHQHEHSSFSLNAHSRIVIHVQYCFFIWKWEWVSFIQVKTLDTVICHPWVTIWRLCCNVGTCPSGHPNSLPEC